ncbi:translation initiation factor IF-2-like [Aquila chrysaetos chrysaetos]|uniref:translation initiation factor IF-2-like n=1 Tax=Aquila chrysaetos chrysaetos TaxID=223781 RepID=UPI001B7D4711|nr:translation initiation factor IF-2-like [Aquila chrysaetos chrysaetos]
MARRRAAARGVPAAAKAAPAPPRGRGRGRPGAGGREPVPGREPRPLPAPPAGPAAVLPGSGGGGAGRAVRGGAEPLRGETSVPPLRGSPSPPSAGRDATRRRRRVARNRAGRRSAPWHYCCRPARAGYRHKAGTPREIDITVQTACQNIQGYSCDVCLPRREMLLQVRKSGCLQSNQPRVHEMIHDFTTVKLPSFIVP